MRNNRRINLANCNFNLKNNNSPNTNEVKASSFNFWDSVCLQESLQTRRKSQKIKVINNSLEESVQIAKRQTGITLIALVVTIVVLLILAGVSISTVLGNNGIIPKANEAKFKTDLASIQEEFTLYVTDKTVENSDFLVGTLNASSDLLTYNTQPEEEKGTGNISSVLKSATAQKYIKNKHFSIIKGDLIYASQNQKELEWAQEVGLAINPYNIDENGVLLSSDTNLMLMDKATGTLVIPEMVTAIGEGAFANVQGLKKIIIPGSVKRILPRAFVYNTTIEEVVMMDGTEEIGAEAFKSCSNLKVLTMPDSINKWGGSAFRGTSKLENIHIPESLKVIPMHAFWGCYALKTVELNNVETVEYGAFEDCIQLYNIEITPRVKAIAEQVFNNCSKLNIDISPDNTIFVKKNGFILAYNETQIIFITQEAVNNNKLIIPDTVPSLGGIGYSHLKNVNIIEIPSSVNSVSNNFFINRVVDIELNFSNDNPTYTTKNNGVYSKDGTILYTHFKNEASISVPEGVKDIKERTFKNLNKLEQLSLPESLISLGLGIADNCPKLNSLRLGKNVNYIDSRVDVFSSIREITIDPANENYTVENNMILNKSKTILIRLINTGTYQNVVVPEGVTEIKDNAFFANTITNVTLPSTLKKLGGFGYVLNLSKLDIPSSVTSISNSCFSESSALNQIIIHKPKGSIPGSPWSCPYGDRAIKWVQE